MYKMKTVLMLLFLWLHFLTCSAETNYLEKKNTSWVKYACIPENIKV